jgi:hypothetical protein
LTETHQLAGFNQTESIKLPDLSDHCRTPKIGEMTPIKSVSFLGYFRNGFEPINFVQVGFGKLRPNFLIGLSAITLLPDWQKRFEFFLISLHDVAPHLGFTRLGKGIKRKKHWSLPSFIFFTLPSRLD